MGIILRLGPRSENTVELLRKKKKVQPIIRGGRKLMIVKETLNFPKMFEVCERVGELFGGNN